MAYQAIYRRWRPTVFDDVIGQEHITKTLKNQIMNDSTAHAYLFCGTRGTGKTSTAKILARAVNCLNPQNGNPCNECDVCKGLLDESILDVTELDGASKNKVENIRDIIDDCVFLPTVAKKKVYIIDEVHMVTQQAFNALLKTLEEPPAHVMFILATTELNKVPITVLSRCQQFEFRRITNADIAQRMEKILAADGYTAEPSALSLVAELGDGSMRDALSILDKCVGAADTALTYDDVVKIVGIADNNALNGIAQAVAQGDSAKVLSMFDNVIAQGKEPGLFAERLVKHLRDILIAKVTDRASDFLNTSEENRKQIEALTADFTKERLLRGIDLLNNAISQARYSSFSRTLFEIALIKMCEPNMEDTKEALLDRLSVLEKKLENGVVAAAPVKQEQAADAPPWETEAPPPAKKPVSPAKPAETPKETPAAPSDSGDPASRWAEIKNYVKAHGGLPIFPHLALVKAKMVNGKFCIVFGDNALVSKTVVSKPGTLKLISDAVKSVTGQEPEISCVTAREIGDDSDDPLKKLEELSKTHSEIQFI